VVRDKVEFKRASDIHDENMKSPSKKSPSKKSPSKKSPSKKSPSKKSPDGKLIKHFFLNKNKIQITNNEKRDLIQKFNVEKNEFLKEISKIEKKIEKLLLIRDKEIKKKNNVVSEIEEKQEKILSQINPENAPSSLVVCNKYLQNPAISKEEIREILELIDSNILNNNSLELNSAIIDCAVSLKEYGKIETGIELLENSIYHDDTNPELHQWLGKLYYLREVNSSDDTIVPIFLKKILMCFEKSVNLWNEKHLENSKDEDIQEKLKEATADRDLIKEEFSN